jgi:4-carboxymuconolactone decarboxylase
MEPDSPLLDISDEEMAKDVFAPELDYMILENMYFDLWARTDVLDRRTRSVVTLGMIMGLGNHDALREHIPVALRNGLTVPELEELVYQAATYLGYVSGKSLRATIAGALKDTGATG